MEKNIVAEQILEALKAVQDPDLHRNIVDLGFIKNLKICGGTVAFDIELTTPACPVKNLLRDQAHQAVKAIPGVETVNVTMTAQVRSAAPQSTPHAGSHASVADGLSGIKNIIAVASGKGGVGKSTVATNLAIALANTGAKVGLMDADVYGPSVPKLLGNEARPEVVDQDGHQRLKPIEKFGVKFISMGLLAGPETPVIWRGPMATKLVQQFLSQVVWGNLDYLLVDLPPGTGDVQLTLTQAAPLNGAVIVTTPQELAVGVTMRGLKMFEQVQVPILGIIENMSGFVCSHCHHETPIFQQGGGKNAAELLGVSFLGSIPLDPSIARGSDRGLPVALQANTDLEGASAGKVFAAIGGRVAQEISKVNEQTKSVHFNVKEVLSKDGTIRLIWNDGHETMMPFRTLRLKCPCAICIDEWSGVSKLDPNTVPEDIHPLSSSHVGRYALQFQWSDGHRTGIYPYNKLRELDPTAPRGN
jgi:ATP-binding protein involved in chromosome partitioning